MQYLTAPPRPRADLAPLAAALSAEEPAGTAWSFDGVDALTPRLSLPAGRESAIPPEAFAARFIEFLSSAPSAWDPYDPANKHGSFDVRNLYWADGENIADGPAAGLVGDDSRIIMDRAIPFVRSAAAAQRPFFVVVWFHAPHAPVVGGPAHRAQYATFPENEQHYYACITAMDEQIGRLRAELAALGVARDPLDVLTRMRRKDLVHLVAKLQDFLRLDVDIGRLTANTARRLVDHDARMRKRGALSVRSRRE